MAAVFLGKINMSILLGGLLEALALFFEFFWVARRP